MNDRNAGYTTSISTTKNRSKPRGAYTSQTSSRNPDTCSYFRQFRFDLNSSDTYSFSQDPDPILSHSNQTIPSIPFPKSRAHCRTSAHKVQRKGKTADTSSNHSWKKQTLRDFFLCTTTTSCLSITTNRIAAIPINQCPASKCSQFQSWFRQSRVHPVYHVRIRAASLSSCCFLSPQPAGPCRKK